MVVVVASLFSVSVSDTDTACPCKTPTSSRSSRKSDWNATCVEVQDAVATGFVVVDDDDDAVITLLFMYFACSNNLQFSTRSGCLVAIRYSCVRVDCVA